jgi:hypothetical protein
VTDPVFSYIKEILYALTVGPVSEDFGLFGGLGVFGRGHVVDHGFDFAGVKDPVFTAAH